MAAYRAGNARLAIDSPLHQRPVYARLGAEQVIIRTAEEKPAPANASIVHVKPRDQRLHWFSAETGKPI